MIENNINMHYTAVSMHIVNTILIRADFTKILNRVLFKYKFGCTMIGWGGQRTYAIYLSNLSYHIILSYPKIV